MVSAASTCPACPAHNGIKPSTAAYGSPPTSAAAYTTPSTKNSESRWPRNFGPRPGKMFRNKSAVRPSRRSGNNRPILSVSRTCPVRLSHHRERTPLQSLCRETNRGCTLRSILHRHAQPDGTPIPTGNARPSHPNRNPTESCRVPFARKNAPNPKAAFADQ